MTAWTCPVCLYTTFQADHDHVCRRPKRQFKFAVDVCVTHDHMSAAQVTDIVLIAVAADNAVEASLAAAQMASSIRSGIAVATHRLKG